MRLDGIEPSPRAVEIAGEEGDAARGSRSSCARRRASSASVRRSSSRDEARVHLRVRRRRRIQRAGAGNARPPSGRPRRNGRAPPRRATRTDGPRGRRDRHRLVRASVAAGHGRRRHRRRRRRGAPDLAGQHDPIGYELQNTVIAVADEIASAAQLVSGKLARVPVTIVRGSTSAATAGPRTSRSRRSAISSVSVASWQTTRSRLRTRSCASGATRSATSPCTPHRAGGAAQGQQAPQPAERRAGARAPRRPRARPGERRARHRNLATRRASCEALSDGGHAPPRSGCGRSSRPGSRSARSSRSTRCCRRLVEAAADADRRAVRGARRPRPAGRGSSASSPPASTPRRSATIGDLPHGRGILGVLIRDAAPLRLHDLSRGSALGRLPAQPSADADVPRRPVGCAASPTATST